jgi:hypothetical protein
MNFSKFMDDVVSFAQNNPIFAIVIVLGLLFFVYRKPKLFFTFLGLGLLLAGLLYLIVNMASLGSEKKKALTDEQEQSGANQ